MTKPSGKSYALRRRNCGRLSRRMRLRGLKPAMSQWISIVPSGTRCRQCGRELTKPRVVTTGNWKTRRYYHERCARQLNMIDMWMDMQKPVLAKLMFRKKHEHKPYVPTFGDEPQ